jgi:hypothetical protein
VVGGLPKGSLHQTNCRAEATINRNNILFWNRPLGRTGDGI